MNRKYIALCLIPFAAACATSQTPGRAGPATTPAQSIPIAIPPTNPAPPVSGFRTPQVMSMPGLETVIGAGAAGLSAQFGQPTLDVREGDARKLQYRGDACVLDVYLYPMRPDAEPTATYVDARRSSDGLDVDRASCVAALKTR